MSKAVLAVLVVACGLAEVASAGVLDPVPLIGGTIRARHVYTIPGIRVNPLVGTSVVCTSLEKSNDIAMAVEVFNLNGTLLNDVTQPGALNGQVVDVPPGATRAFEILDDNGDLASIVGDAFVSNVGNVPHGSARVLSTSSKIACVAAFLDRVNSPPESYMPLPLISGKQNGD